MKRKMLITALCLIMTFAGFSQHALEGRVFDHSSQISLPGANVLVKGTYKGVFTNKEGHFVLHNLPAGQFILQVTYMGYEPKEIEVELPARSALEIGLQQTATLTEEVVVVGLRADGRTPATYTDIQGEELAARNLGQDLPFLISLTPSVIVSSDAGAGVGYTWMKVRGSDDTRINVTLNGVPLNNPESHGVWWVNTPDIATSVSNMQVQRGVGLSTHGAGAFGATISLKTHDLKETTYAELENSFGSFNTLKNTASFGTGLLKGKWAFDGRLSKISSDGFVDRAASDLKSFYLSGGYYGKKTVVKAITFSGNETTYQAWNGVPGSLLDTDRTYNPSGLYYDSDGDVQFYDNETDNYQQDHFQLHLSHAFSSGLTGNAALHYTRGKGYYEQYRYNDKFSSYNLPNLIVGDQTISRSDLVRQRWLDNHFAGMVFSLNYNSFSRLSLTWGGAANQYDGKHFGEIIWARYAQHVNKDYRYYDNDALKYDVNTYVKAIFELLPGMNLLADMQYRHVDYTFEGPAWVLGEVVALDQKVNYDFFNPKAGISWAISPSSTFYSFAGIGNREPVRRDFTESSPESRPRPEKMRNLELGYRFHGKSTLLGVNLYLMDYKDQLILTGQINDVGGFSRTNIDNSYRAGIELEAGVIISPKLQWQGNATFSRNKIDLFVEYSDAYDNDWNWVGTDVQEYRNTDISFSPSVIAASIFSYEPLRDLNLSLSTKYVGKQYIDNTMSADRMLDAYLVNDLRLNYVLRPGFFREVELVAQVNNLFNALYETNAWIYKGVVGDQGLITIEDGYFPQAGRHFLAGVNLRF
ncbi:MAG: TonB-dependent receptor [Bacteroides sp.]|jgi:iron complex outermembrane receptor protein|nr:TonB-dependent receptor [Bacteroides sp.]